MFNGLSRMINMSVVCFLWVFFQNELLDAELLLLRITPDAEGRFGFNVKVSRENIELLYCI